MYVCVCVCVCLLLTDEWKYESEKKLQKGIFLSLNLFIKHKLWRI